MSKKQPGHKYIFVLGGVMSGVGKGITSSSIGKILQDKGFAVNLVKVDPYLNVDAGTMNPTEHGEVFVLRSGLETDQDMGNYERFLGQDQTPYDYMTSGMVYQDVIEKERRLEYNGKCVEAIPHIRDEIIKRLKKAAEVNKSNISVVEIGGTVGDYQNIMFIEAARALKVKFPEDVLFIIVTYVPTPQKIGEMKTKPTQNAVRMLNSYGVQPDFIIARSELEMDKKRREKIATSCSVSAEKVISAPDIESIYDVPLNFEREKLGEIILSSLKLRARQTNGLKDWKAFVAKTKKPGREVKIAIVGKYFDSGDFVLSDAYISVIESIKFSAYKLNSRPKITWLNSKDFENGKKNIKELRAFGGIIVPGGFGETGIEGKLSVIKYARKNKIPYFGLCYGMQLMLIEHARNVMGFSEANTTEINTKTNFPVIDILPEQKKNLSHKKFGASMRLGTYEALLKKGTIAKKAYGTDSIEERHRHRYEVNPLYVKDFLQSGIVFSGTSPDGKLMEIAELPKNKHPFFLGTQFHPEFQARPLTPHPLFTTFIRASLGE